MGLTFQSLRSSSSGNCYLIRTGSCQIAIDCGYKSQRDCEAVLRRHAGRLEDLDAVLVSHTHGDHIGYPSLRVLADHGVPIRAPGRACC